MTEQEDDSGEEVGTSSASARPAATPPATTPPAATPPAATQAATAPPAGVALPAHDQQGICWSWELDFETLSRLLDDPAPWSRTVRPGHPTGHAEGDPGSPVDRDRAVERWEDQDAVLAAELAADMAGETREVPVATVAGQVAEALPPGPSLAGWLAMTPPTALDDGALPGVAASFRRLASWAQAAELAVVAQIASRSAAADPEAEVDEVGRPAVITEDATGQVSLALALSRYGAQAWTHLGVQLSWRLAATGAALAAGKIDLSRARLVAETTATLPDEVARSVEARVLPRAGELTNSQLRAVLRRAVIAADPEGAERRRADAEHRAKVSLYPDDEGTATLIGQNLPGVRAAAAMSRLTALARALKSSGAAGGMDLLRAQVMLGLLLGTLPFIPPPADGPPDAPPSDPPTEGPENGPLPGDDLSETAPWPGDLDAPPVEDDNAPAESGPTLDDDSDDGDAPCQGPAPAWPAVPPSLLPALSCRDLPRLIPAAARPANESGALRPVPGLLDLAVPWSTLAGTAAGAGRVGRLGPITPAESAELARLASTDPAAQWRMIVCDQAGQAIAVTKIPRVQSPPGTGPPDGPGLVGRVSLSIGVDALSRPPPPGTGPLAAILRRALQAARYAADDAYAHAQADADAGGCAHTRASSAYRPSPRLREYVSARDGTCRMATCRQPAWHSDLDHTVPHHRGGPTCSCNLGGHCRTHHQLKQLPHWRVIQPKPGTFIWTTPAGRSYLVTPDSYEV